ncbi:MAG: ABC transporter permease [Proteobacteria bacterium]|jgi:peptide/nickel transport system permease protein|nr:ABC transporter permease [Pseudomonadota bacterium]
MLGIAIVSILILGAVFAPWISPSPSHATGDINILARLKPPGSEYWFGTDDLGRDIFSRVVFGTRKSLVIGFGIVMLALFIGVPLGLVAGYYGGKIDESIMRVSDAFLAFPPLLLPIAIGGALGTSMKINMIAIALAWWPWYVRLIRAQVLIVREQLYIAAAKSIGVKDVTIITRHVIVNSISPVIVQASLDLGYALLASASLSFIGIGAKPPMAEWGLMITEARPYFLDFWWTTTFPGIAIFVAVVGFNLLGDGLRDILDPKVR